MMQPSEMCALVGTIDPDAYAASTYTSDGVDMGAYQKLMAVLSVGTIGASGTVDAKLQQATTSGGTFKDIVGGSITQLTQAGGDSDSQVVINLDGINLDVADNYRHVRLSVTVAADLGATLYGFAAGYGPASDGNLSSVAEVLTV